MAHDCTCIFKISSDYISFCISKITYVFNIFFLVKFASSLSILLIFKNNQFIVLFILLANFLIQVFLLLSLIICSSFLLCYFVALFLSFLNIYGSFNFNHIIIIKIVRAKNAHLASSAMCYFGL